MNSAEIGSTWLPLARFCLYTISAIALPGIFYWITVRRDRMRRTMDLIRALGSQPSLVDAYRRIFAARRFEEGDKTAFNPYASTEVASFEHDAVTVLNFFDIACIEIREGIVDEELLYKTSRDAILGMRLLLEKLDAQLQKDQLLNYPHLVQVTDAWKKRTERENIDVATKIPARRVTANEE